jgi:hypothetical protein
MLLTSDRSMKEQDDEDDDRNGDADEPQQNWHWSSPGWFHGQALRASVDDRNAGADWKRIREGMSALLEGSEVPSASSGFWCVLAEHRRADWASLQAARHTYICVGLVGAGDLARCCWGTSKMAAMPS